MKRYTQNPQEQFLSLNRLREVEQKLDLITREFHKKQISDPEKIVLDHFEFMDLFKISRRTSQSWRVQKKIEYCLIGGRIYFTLADIQQLLEQHKVRTAVRAPQKISENPREDLRGSAGNPHVNFPQINADLDPQITADDQNLVNQSTN